MKFYVHIRCRNKVYHKILDVYGMYFKRNKLKGDVTLIDKSVLFIQI